jgi:hypothetical protein
MATLAISDSAAQSYSAKSFPGQETLAAGLLLRCAVTSRSRPRREASRCLAVELAGKVCAGVGRDPDRVGSFLFVFRGAGAVHLPP